MGQWVGYSFYYIPFLPETKTKGGNVKKYGTIKKKSKNKVLNKNERKQLDKVMGDSKKEKKKWK